MKIIKFVMFCIIAVILLSCSEEDPQPTSAGMVGSWAVTAVDYKGTTTTSAQGLSIKADFTGTGKEMNLTVTFEENPNAVTSVGSYTVLWKTTMAGQSTTEEVPVEDFFTDGTWTLNGKTLTITNPDVSDKATVVEQTATTLKLKWAVQESETDQGITVTQDIQGTYTLTKK